MQLRWGQARGPPREAPTTAKFRSSALGSSPFMIGSARRDLRGCPPPSRGGLGGTVALNKDIMVHRKNGFVPRRSPVRLAAAAALLAILLAESASACQFDTDCGVGSKCVKSGANIYGWCVGGLNPGNANDKKPARDPLDITGKRGSTCTFDVDCGAGGQCVKGSGSIRGTCL